MRSLTKREREYLEALINHPGDTQRQRARRLGCAYWTAVKHSQRVRRKLGACSDKEIVVAHFSNKGESK